MTGISPRSFGQSGFTVRGGDKYRNIRLGINGRLDTLQAAILLQKLKIFPAEIIARQRWAEKYTQAFADLREKIITPFVPAGYSSSWAQYSLLAEKRELILAGLAKAGIPSAIYYPLPVHLQEAFGGLQYRAGDFPVSESASKRIFSLPMHPYLDDGLIDRIAETIHQTIGKSKGDNH